MAEVIEVTGKILFEIRDEIKKTNQTLDNVDKRLTAVEVGMTGMQEDIKEIKQDLKAVHGFLQRDIMALADRVNRIERHLRLDPGN